MNQIEKSGKFRVISKSRKYGVTLKAAILEGVIAAMLIAFIVLLFPSQLRAQSVAFIAVLESYEKMILGYEQNTASYSQQINQEQQQVIAPSAQVSSTQSWLTLAQGQYNGWFSRVNGISVNSATTPQVSAYQSSIQNGGSTSSIRTNYTQVYGSQPNPTAVSSNVASSVDAADTSANEALTLADTSDVMSQNFIKSANQMESSAASAAPGNSTLVQAQSQAMQLYSNAIMHRLLASMLRQQAERLAEIGSEIKNSAAAHNAAVSSFGSGSGSGGGE